ncbi:MAG: class I SAM-dependent methyltransferase [Gammaproteobacteria bacterium]|nr:class I SAM-dependent methyltransferase [Gammaproteobacteria bacterium]
MTVCPDCDTEIDLVAYRCEKCCVCINQVEGFRLFDPQLADQNDGFLAESFEGLADVETGNFWFESRSYLINSFIEKYVEVKGDFLEVGVGTGFVLSRLIKHTSFQSYAGSDLHLSGLKKAKSTLPEGVFLVQFDARRAPYSSEFNAVGMFDCLEHIQEDSDVIRRMHKALTEKGYFILTVPQHPFLWSESDRVACHKRRYRVGELEKKLIENGYEIVRSTSFVTLLSPLMFANALYRRYFPKKAECYIADGLVIPDIINSIFMIVMSIERGLINLGLNLPFGGSRLIVARKKV